jgi:hypothetical protein
LKKYFVKYVPTHVYFSVLDWLFPEQVGKKYKAKYAFPIAGEYVVDVDYYSFHKLHHHYFIGNTPICLECLEVRLFLTLRVCEAIEKNYSNVQLVFSGRRGFHVHVLDFDHNDWTHYVGRNPIKSFETARFKYTKQLATRYQFFNRSHFILSVDPMRVVTLPNTLNADTSLKCLYLGIPTDLEKLSMRQLVEMSKITF